MPESPFTCFIGIDVSKETLDLCLWLPERQRKASLHTSNDAPGFARLLKWLAKHALERERSVVCLENTGLYDDHLLLYDDHLLDALTLEGWSCAVVKTTALEKVRPEHHRKDDGFDAALLAEYAYRYADKLSFYEAPHPVIEHVRLLHQERRRLVTQRASVKQLLGESIRRRGEVAFAQQLWQEQLAFYERQIDAIEGRLDALIREDDDVYRRFEQIKSIEGFGPQSAMLWISLFYGESRLNARRIASRFGFAPHAEQSGTTRKRSGHSSGHGKAEMRKVLTLCARSAGVHKQGYRTYKQRKLAEGKQPRLITNNIINKLIHVACAVWNQDGQYDPNHVSRFVSQAA